MSEPQVIITVGELAAWLHVPKSWIYARTRDGAATGRYGRSGTKRGSRAVPAPEERLPHIKIGRHLRFYRAEVEAWLARHHRNGQETPGTPPEDTQEAPGSASESAI